MQRRHDIRRFQSWPMINSRAEALPPTDAVEAAIVRVLAAERGARDAVARAKNDAAAMTEAARATVRILNERTECRIRALHIAFDRKVSAALAALEAEGADFATHHDLSADEQARIEQAVAKLAAELTGGIG